VSLRSTLLEAILAQRASGELPPTPLTEELERAARAILAGTPPSKALGLTATVGRPVKVYTAAEEGLTRFVQDRVAAAGHAYGSQQAAIRAAIEQTFDGQRFDYEQVVALIRRHFADASDEWKLTLVEQDDVPAEWWAPPL
jgi:hypothetical protein